MIEVGSYQGGSVLVFAGAMRPHSNILLIDMCDRKHAVPKLERAIEQLRSEGHTVTLARCDSASDAAWNAAMTFGYAQFLYIDGCHRTPMVIHDYMTFRHFIEDGGLICFHDVAQPKLVRRAFEHYMTPVWDKQGLHYRVIGVGEYNRKNRPWATGIGLLEWNANVLDIEPTDELSLLEIVQGIDSGTIPH